LTRLTTGASNKALERIEASGIHEGRLHLWSEQRTHYGMSSSLFAFEAISRPGRQEWVAIAIFVALTVLLLPFVLWKNGGLGQGDCGFSFALAGPCGPDTHSTKSPISTDGCPPKPK
jgi:hypothetical protein